MTKEELIEQLKSIANDETEVTLSMGAMCYSPRSSAFEFQRVKCESCGKELLEDLSRKDTRISGKVQLIEVLGFDAKVERVCSDCASKLGLKNKDGQPLRDHSLHNVFYFKTKEQENYNISVADSRIDYDAVIAFLKNKKTFTGYHGRTHLVKDHLELIKKMTGISID